MLDPVSVALKFGFLAVLYLFLLWVAWSAVKDLRRTRRPTEPAVAMSSDATGFHTASAGLGADGDGDSEPSLVVERAPGHEPGMSYEIGDGAVLGRGNVEIKLEDPFASSRHARLVREGPVMVLEDLGSTNGTFLNGEPVDGPQPLHPGDVIRIGDSEFTYST
jgi:hypothetical protein